MVSSLILPAAATHPEPLPVGDRRHDGPEAAPGPLFLPSLAIADESEVVPLWPGGAPGYEGKNPGRKDREGKGKGHHRLVSSIHQPSLTVFLPPKEKATGAAVVICPGGGHRYLAIDHEGYDVARWLASQGVAGFVLKYRLANEEGSRYKVDIHALADARRAIRLVRGRAKEWGVDPLRVGLMGFSAGASWPSWRGRSSSPAAPTPTILSIASIPGLIF